MANRTDTGHFACSFCGVVYQNSVKADQCRDSHEVLYVPITYKEIGELSRYIHLGDASVLTTEFINKVSEWQKRAVLLQRSTR